MQAFYDCEMKDEVKKKEKGIKKKKEINKCYLYILYSKIYKVTTTKNKSKKTTLL